MKLNEAVSRRLGELLQKQAMTQYHFSGSSGLAKSTISNIVHCQYDSMKLRIIHEMCQGLGIGISEFFAGLDDEI